MAIISNSGAFVPDIGNALNAAGGSVDVYKALEYFSPDANIKAFAKYKPTEYEGDFPNQYNQWHSKDMTCQINVKLASTLSELKNMFENNDIGWSFKYWDVSPTYPYRLGDFRGYKSDAKSCISGIEYPASIGVTSSVGNTIGVTALYREQDEYELKFSDIQGNAYINTMDKWYFGVVYYTSKNSTLKIRTMDIPITSNLNDTVTIPVTISDTGTLYAYPVLSQIAYSTTATILNTGTYITPVPHSNKISIEIIENAPFSIKINTGESYFTLSNGSVQVTSSYYIKGTQAGNISGKWWYTAIDEDGMPLGASVEDPVGSKTIYYINGEKDETFTGTKIYIAGTGAAAFAGIRVEFRSTQTGGSFGGNVFTQK